MHDHNQNPQPKISVKPVIKPVIKLKLKETTDNNIDNIDKTPKKAPIEPVKRKTSTTNKTKVKLKQVSIDTCIADIDSVDDTSCSSTSSNASESTTYIVPVYGVEMRMSLDNKFIYDMEFNHVGTVTDSKSIEWIE